MSQERLHINSRPSTNNAQGRRGGNNAGSEPFAVDGRQIRPQEALIRASLRDVFVEEGLRGDHSEVARLRRATLVKGIADTLEAMRIAEEINNQ